MLCIHCSRVDSGLCENTQHKTTRKWNDPKITFLCDRHWKASWNETKRGIHSKLHKYYTQASGSVPLRSSLRGLQSGLQIIKTSEPRKLTTDLQHCDQDTGCSSADLFFCLFTIVWSLHEEEEGGRSQQLLLRPKTFSLNFIKHLQKNKSTETFAGWTITVCN